MNDRDDDMVGSEYATVYGSTSTTSSDLVGYEAARTRVPPG